MTRSISLSALSVLALLLLASDPQFVVKASPVNVPPPRFRVGTATTGPSSSGTGINANVKRIPLSKRLSLAEGGVVKPSVLRAQVQRAEAKIARGFAHFQTNTGVRHPSDNGALEALVGSRPAKRGVGSNTLTDDNNVLWQGTVSVGTPPVEFIVDFDTGSSDLFLPSVGCTVNCDNHTRYDTSASSTAHDLGLTFDLAFGDGSTVSGEQFTDTVTISGLTATNQTVGSAAQYSTGFASPTFMPDGLMGMGYPSISRFNANPVFQTLVSQGQTDQPVFAFNLAQENSELLIGGLNASKISSTFTVVPVTQQGFWQVALDAISLGSTPAIQNTQAIIDTGTTLILGDTDSVQQLYAQIPGSADASQTVGDGFFTVPCSSIDSLDLSLTFGGTAFSISPETFNLGQASPGSSDCVGGISTIDGFGFWIVGDVFLQNVYTGFDTQDNVVGFANLSQ